MRKVVFLFLLMAVVNHPVMANEVSEIQVSPVSFEPFGNVTVVVSADNSVEKMSLTYCRISPDYLCYFPSYEMDTTENGFSVSIELKDGEGTKVGFSILYTTSDENSHKIPSADSANYGLEVGEPVEDTYYFVFEIGSSSTNSTLPNLLIPLMASLYIMPLLVRRR